MDFIPDISSRGNHFLQETMITEESDESRRVASQWHAFYVILNTSSRELGKHKRSKPMNTITTDEVKAMIHTIDVRLDQKSHYDTNHTPKGVIYHVGNHKYVTLDDYSQAFEDYEWNHNGAEWACYLYTLTKNNPERIDFYTKAYNLGGMQTLETLYNNVTGNEPQTIVYPIYKH